MRKQKSAYTLSSSENLCEQQVSPLTSYYYEDQLYSDTLWPQFEVTNADMTSAPYENYYQFDYSATGDSLTQNFYTGNIEEAETVDTENYSIYGSWNAGEPYSFLQQSVNDSYDLPVENEVQYFEVQPFHQEFLQYGIPAVTDYRAVALLLRHLIRVDLTSDGSVCIYNFPSKSITALNGAGNKCYITHPNGRVFQDGPVINIVTENNRLVKISRRGVTFSSSQQSLAYLVDESGTKTTTAKFADLSRDLTMDVFYDGNRRYNELEQECHKMAAETAYENYPDGSELWMIGRTRIKQDRWGEVIISQNNGRIVTTSPTIRRVTVESPSVNIKVDCFSKNYLTVRKDACAVTSGFCGLTVQNRSQKAGLDRCGRLVLF